MKWTAAPSKTGVSVTVWHPHTGDLRGIDVPASELPKGLWVLNDWTRHWPVLPITAEMVRTRLEVA